MNLFTQIDKNKFSVNINTELTDPMLKLAKQKNFNPYSLNAYSLEKINE